MPLFVGEVVGPQCVGLYTYLQCDARISLTRRDTHRPTMPWGRCQLLANSERCAHCTMTIPAFRQQWRTNRQNRGHAWLGRHVGRSSSKPNNFVSKFLAFLFSLPAAVRCRYDDGVKETTRRLHKHDKCLHFRDVRAFHEQSNEFRDLQFTSSGISSSSGNSSTTWFI